MAHEAATTTAHAYKAEATYAPAKAEATYAPAKEYASYDTTTAAVMAHEAMVSLFATLHFLSFNSSLDPSRSCQEELTSPPVPSLLPTDHRSCCLLLRDHSSRPRGCCHRECALPLLGGDLELSERSLRCLLSS